MKDKISAVLQSDESCHDDDDDDDNVNCDDIVTFSDYKTLLTKAQQLVDKICSHFSKSYLKLVSCL